MLEINIARYIDRAFIEAHVTKIVRRAELGECWEWNRARTSRGYGHFRVVVDGVPHFIKAHRASFEVFTGEKLGDREGTHRCDNTCCCNPEHVVPGSHEENMADMKRKGRAVGHPLQRNPNARLSSTDVEHIRSVPFSYGIIKSLALKYGVTPTHIGRIRNGQSWPAQRAA